MNPARVTFTEYRPGRSLWPTKIPFSSVSSSMAGPPANSGVSQTLAPICGLPAGSTTRPVSLPKLCAARSEALERKRAERTKAAVLSDFTDHLTEEVCAATFSLGGDVTVKSADLLIL